MAVQLALLLATLVCSVTAQCNTPWEDCGSTEVTIDSVSLQNCCSAPCVVVKGQDMKITFSFTPKEDISNMTQNICGLIGETCINMPGFSATDVCTYASPACPFKSGMKETVTVSYPVDKSFPSVTLTGDWKLFDSTGKDLLGCFSMVLKLVDPEKLD